MGFRVSASRHDFGGDGLGCFFVDVEQADTGPAAGESLGNRPSDTASRSCDDGEFAIKAKCV